MSLEQFGIIGGLIFGIAATAVSILVFVQHAQYKKKSLEEKQEKDLIAAKEQGAHDQREKEMKDQIDNAHRKIREDVMPKLLELDRSHAEINTTFEYIKLGMDETKTILREMSSSIIRVSEQVAGIQGERRAGKAKGAE